jgi:hypothetical protein
MNNSKEIFKNIYENFGFGSTESRSGPGSTIAETEKLIDNIRVIIKSLNIESVTDLPCGDLNWINYLFQDIKSYTGCDIVEECVKENQIKYPEYNFKCLDLETDNIPDADLLIVRDVLGHQPLEVALNMIRNILNSNCKYLLSTTWASKKEGVWAVPEKGTIHRENEGVDYGRFYPVNLMGDPFNFPEPELFIEEQVQVDGYDRGNRKSLALWNIKKIKDYVLANLVDIKDISEEPVNQTSNKQTIVTGLWNINRAGRDFDHYIESFIKLLEIPQNLFIYIPKELESLVWEHRKIENTFIRFFELEDLKTLYLPFWDRTSKIRTDNNWTDQAEWLKDSPQCSNEWYNPIVQSKMFMLNDATIINPFDTEYFYWLDAGITNTVPHHHLVHHNVLDKLPEFSNPFLFLSYPYTFDVCEIHGFEYPKMCEYSNAKVEYVCRGGLFGGHKHQVNKANATYYSLLDRSLSEDLMGTEESLFTIMSYLEPDVYRRYELNINGHIMLFTQALLDDSVELAEPAFTRLPNAKEYSDRDVSTVKTHLYMLTFNFPEQILHTIESMKKNPEWLTKPSLFLLDNSTDALAKTRNQAIAKEYDFEYIDLGGNTGICGGRQSAAEHFHDSDADFMLFFEDDMTVNPPELEGQFCRNGFRKYIPNIYNLVHRIMLKEKFDFLKLSFTEVYFDNDKQCSWYNVPQSVRSNFWPDYDQLPVSGLDPNVPKTNFNNIYNLDELTYIDGEIYYANWPMIVSKEGNKKMFIDTKWASPFEQTWMSHMYQLTKEDRLKPAVLLASPIWHDRIMHYQPDERREN